MRHVSSEPPGPGQADHGVEVGAVQVDLSAGLVDQIADLHDLWLEHPVCRRVGDHEGG